MEHDHPGLASPEPRPHNDWGRVGESGDLEFKEPVELFLKTAKLQESCPGVRVLKIQGGHANFDFPAC